MTNPLLTNWETPHKLPPFKAIRAEHYLPAFEAAFAEHNAEIDAIVNNPAPASFENTIEALEAAGSTLSRISPVFFVLLAADSDDELRKVQTALVPKYSAHTSAIYSRKDLFARVKAVVDAKPSLDGEQQQLLNETYKAMQRQGAGLSDKDAAAVASIDEQLAGLQTKFGQNVLIDSNQFELVLEEQDLQGLPVSVCTMAAQDAAARGYEGKYLFTISRSSFTPFMQFSERRDLREQLWLAYTHCANNQNANDNGPVAEQIATLRAERAKLMGYKTHADFTLDDRMAGTVSQVNGLLDQLWEPASQKVKQEREDLQARLQKEGGNVKLAPWDWWYYTEKLRQDQFDLDAETLKPYFELERVREGAFRVATKLYGITFTEVTNLESYHPDVKGFEVRESNGDLIGLFLTDYFMRPSKKAGAWMNALRLQQKFGNEEYPIILNTCNFPKAAPCLLTMDEVRTLFHEFGHALHGLLSNVHYRSLSGTSVKRDFVELPSQIMEHWAVEPEVLRSYAKHIETNEVIPDNLIDKIHLSATFNQGFLTTEYLAASYLDLSWHAVTTDDEVKADSLEAKAMENIELIEEIAPRYRSSYFQHIFSGGYSAGYYAYIWAEVLDTDAYEEFKARGIFDQATAAAFRENILSKGGTEDPMTLYKRFKGREPEVGPLKAARGL